MAWRSKWLPAWKNCDSKYAASNVLDPSVITDLSKPFRLVFKRNDRKRKGDNRPSYLFAFADVIGSTSNLTTSKDLQYDAVHDQLEFLFNKINELDDNYITVSNAIEVALRLLRDFEDGYSYDDLCVEVNGFMEEDAFNLKDKLLNETDEI